jgi:hypothetical protein
MVEVAVTLLDRLAASFVAASAVVVHRSCGVKNRAVQDSGLQRSRRFQATLRAVGYSTSKIIGQSSEKFGL